MSDASSILALPYIMPSQAQKHVTHNEALRQLDVLVQLTVEAFAATTPPGLAPDGSVYALGNGTTADWAGQDGKLAAWIDGGWIFITPRDGWRAWGRGDNELRVWDGSAWVSIAGDGLAPEDLQNLDGVGIGTGSDANNRLAVAGPATLLTHTGNGHQLKINKATPGDTAALLFQTGWSGRAEMGLAGNDNFIIKVSDGGSWQTGLSVDAATGHVGAGVYSPAAPLHVKDLMRLEPASTPPSPSAGDIYFDSSTSKLRCYDGSGWNDLF